MIDLIKRVAELENWPNIKSDYFTSVAQNWENTGRIQGSHIYPVMTGREIVRVTEYSQHERVIYILEENLLGDMFLYEVDMQPKKLISFVISS